MCMPLAGMAQFNTDRLVTIGRSALYYEDYVLSMQYFNQVISAKPYLYEPWYFRGVAKYYLDDYVGAESDCTAAIERNPYVVGIYELRGLARIRQGKFDEAVDDYTRALKYAPDNKNLWHNRVLCRIQQKDYARAHLDLDTMLTRWSGDARGHTMRAEVYLMQKDTARAVEALDRSLKLDAYDGGTWSARAAISLARGEWKDAEERLDKAIHLAPKHTGNYINRALARINRNNLRGAMADYDTALDFDPNSFLGHYNRGLLRARVGDDNRAIVDFDFVLKLEPDNMMALFNRALLLDRTGDLRGAIRDYSKVIEEFPNFWTGLQQRADCYRRLGMVKQAEADEFRVYKARLYKSLYGTQPRMDKEKMRKRSEVDPDKYNQLVVDDEQDMEHEYESDYRGQVQNRRADMAFMSMYELSYEQHRTEVKPFMAFDRMVEAYNSGERPADRIYINCVPTVLDEKRSAGYFSRIDSLSAELSRGVSPDRRLRTLLSRAVAYSVMQNFESAIDDLSDVIVADSTLSMAYWQRAVCRAKSNEVDASHGEDTGMRAAAVLADFSAAIRHNPLCAYLYYDRGNVYASLKDYARAIEDYDRALGLDANLAEAYYNRGLTRLLTDSVADGVADMSKAGELGLYKAYSVIKKYSKK